VNVLVAYMTKTGNTKKIAEAIYGEIREAKTIKPIEEVDSIEGYDLAFLGFPIHQMGPDKKTVKLLETLCVDGRCVVLFITHASPEDGPDLPPWLELFKQAARGAALVDLFHCQGELAKGVKRMMSIMPNRKFRMWAKLDNSQGQPDQARIERARAFAREVMAKVKKA
jgi:flavodoxin